MFDIMRQAQQMQAKMTEMHAELENMEVEGTSGGGMVKITLSGKGEMRGCSIDPSLINPDDAEVLEDLVLAAHNDANKKVKAEMAERMKAITGGLPIPPGLNPFG